MSKTSPNLFEISWKSVLPKADSTGTDVYEIDFYLKKSIDSTEKSNSKTLCGNELPAHQLKTVFLDSTVLCQVDAYNYQNLRDSTAISVKEMKLRKIRKIKIKETEEEPFKYFKDAIADGLILGQFNYNLLKGINKKKDEDCYISIENHTFFRPEAQNIARFLTNTPPNLMTPSKFSICAKEIIDHFKLPIFYECLSEEDCRKMNMNLFLSVGQGSKQESKFLILSYHGRDSSEKKQDFKSYNGNSPIDKTSYDVTLVGKGITFDSGGLSLKPPKSQPDMKGDMMGAAVTLSAIVSAAHEKLKMNMKVFIPLAENLPSASATKPSDVFIGRSGISVEINNTDAEGRLVLADGLACAEEFTSKCIISCATLTGAVIVSLGAVFYGVFSTDDEIYKKIEDAGNLVADQGWRLPLDKRYVKLLESDVADLSNVAYTAGSVTAAVFLKEFVTKTPYVHLDIAGMLETNEMWGKKFTCRPSAMLFEFFKGMSD